MMVGFGTVVVVLSGEFDVCNAAALADHLAEIAGYRPQRLVFEMAEASFMDCASARLIVGARRSLPDGTRPVISNPPLVVRRVLQIIGLDTLRPDGSGVAMGFCRDCWPSLVGECQLGDRYEKMIGLASGTRCGG